MTFLKGITVALDNLGVSFEVLIIIVFIAGMPIFYAKDTRIGHLMLFILSTGIFIWFYTAGYQWSIPLSIALVAIVLLAFSLLSGMQTKSVGVV
jgi:hypothetical protein